MQLQFSLEDDSPEVNIGIDEDSVNIEIKNIEDEIEETNNKLNFVSSTIDNLINIKHHVKKFGVTRQMLHLVNTNNNLGAAIGLVLPYYEDESENLDQIDEDELPDVEVVLEGLGEAITKGFKYLIEKIKAFGKWLLELIPFRKKKVEKVKEGLKKENIVKEAKEDLGKSWMEQAEEMKKDLGEAVKKMGNAHKDLEELEKKQKEQGEQLDSMIKIMKEKVDQLMEEPLPDKAFREKFFTPENSKKLMDIFFSANRAWNDGSIQFVDGRTDNFKIEEINKLFLQTGEHFKYYFITNDGLLKFEALSLEDFISKGYKQLELAGEDEASKWTLKLLEKLSDDIIKLYVNFNNSTKTLKVYEQKVEKLLKDPNEASKETTTKLKHNVTMMITLYNDIMKRFNDFVDIYVQTANHSKTGIINKLMKMSKAKFQE